ncbi:hypothetical protein Tco_1531712 [Tanacetum coccineum]
MAPLTLWSIVMHFKNRFWVRADAGMATVIADASRQLRAIEKNSIQLHDLNWERWCSYKIWSTLSCMGRKNTKILEAQAKLPKEISEVAPKADALRALMYNGKLDMEMKS